MSPLYFVVISLARFVFRVFYRMKVYGSLDRLKGGAILAPNHVSFLDPPIVAAASVGSVHFLARETLFRSFFGRLIRALNAHPVKGHTGSVGAIKMVCTLLREGRRIIIFPEGSRNRENRLAEFKSGIGMLLSRSETAVVPVYIHGTFDIWPRGRKYPRLFGKTAVVFGSPILWKEYASEDKKRAREMITNRLAESIEKLRLWYESGRSGSPP